MSNKQHKQPTNNINSAVAVKVFATIAEDIDLLDGYGGPCVLIKASAGTLDVQMVRGLNDGDESLTFFFDGDVHPVQAKKIYATSTCTNVHLYWNTYHALKEE